MFNRIKHAFSYDRQIELVLRQVLINMCVELICLRSAKDLDTVQAVIMSTGGVDIMEQVRKVTLLSEPVRYKVEIELGVITTKEYPKTLQGLEELRKDLEDLLEFKYGRKIPNT